MNISLDIASPFLLRVSDRFVPAQSGPDADGLRRRGRLLLAFDAACFAMMLWTLVFQFHSGSPKAAAASGITLFFVVLSTIALRWGVSIAVLTRFAVSSLYLVATGITFATNGLWPGGLYSLVLVPAVAVLLIDRRSGLRWGLLAIGTIAIGGSVASQTDGWAPIALSANEIQSANFRVAILMAAAATAMAYTYASLYDRATKALVKSLADVGQGERRFRALVANSYDLIAELDREGRVIYASPGFEEILGWSPREIAGRSFAEAVHPDDYPLAREYWGRLSDKGAVHQEAIRHRTRQGGWRWLETSMRSYALADGSDRIVAVSRDVTERFDTERVARHQHDLAAAGTMAAGMAHQLNNPIGSMLAAAQYARLLESDPSFHEVALESFESIQRDAKRCGAIARSLLRFVRQESPERQVEDINLVVRHAAIAVEREGLESGSNIMLDLLLEPADVSMSSIQIEQALINLIRNSILAGATEVHLDVGVEKPNCVSVSVRDNGSGVPDIERHRIFTPFYTTRRGSGSGLGLTVARQIIEDHAGSLELMTTNNTGTIFRIELPLVSSLNLEASDSA